MKLSLVLLLIIKLFSTGVVYSQEQPKKEKYTISGFIKEIGSGELLVGTNVFVPSLQVGTTANNYGFYSITLEKDSVEVAFSFVGYKPRLFKIYLDKNIALDVELSSSNNLEAVEIIASKREKISESSRMSVIEIPISQIKDIPALLGEKDALKVIQLLPGVQSGSEGNSGLYVRGGGPDQNLIILDDATVYNAFHLFGFFSLFNGDALKSIELTKGGFPARYGGRLSSVLDISMKEGSKEEIKGEVGIGLISSRATLEGPLKKGKSSFLISGRRTYIDFLTKPLMPREESFGYFFYDFNAKVNYDFGNKDKLYLSGYFGRDKAQANYNVGNEEFELFWGNVTGTARWNHLFNEKLFANTSLTVSDYNFTTVNKNKFLNQDFESEYSSGIRDYSIKFDLDYRPSPRHYIRMGFISTYHLYTPSAVLIKDKALNNFRRDILTQKTIESGIYIEDDVHITNRLKVNLGLRASHFISEGKQYLRPEPRISGRYLLKKDLSVKASFASMNQYIHLLTQTGVGLSTDLWVPATDKVPPQSSYQFAIGLAKDLNNPELTVSIEGYYKKSDQIIGYKEGASFLTIPSPEDNGGSNNTIEEVEWESKVTSGQGWSYGIELFVQKKVGRFTGWVGYTLSYTKLQFDSINSGEKFWARYDRRHDASLVGIYKLKENEEKRKKITLSATWVYGTGNALTLPVSQFIARPNVPGRNPDNSTFETLNEYNKVNDFRMAPYHRLDFGIQFHKKLEKAERTWEISIYNVYNRKNPFFYYVNTNAKNERVLKQVSLFPIIPSFSYSYKF